MLSNEEKKAIESLIEIREFANLSSYKDTKIIQLNAIDVVLNLIEKQSKEIEELKKDKLELINKNHVVHLKDVEKELREMKKVIDTKNAEIEFLNVIHESYKEMVEENNFISKDKIKEILGIEEKIDNEKLLSLLQTIVDENARLEDIEDRKVQIEYNNVFNKGVKSVEDKIKAKIEEVKDGTYDAKIVLESLLEKEGE